jgi:hypothetical protein
MHDRLPTPPTQLSRAPFKQQELIERSWARKRFIHSHRSRCAHGAYFRHHDFESFGRQSEIFLFCAESCCALRFSSG